MSLCKFVINDVPAFIALLVFGVGLILFHFLLRRRRAYMLLLGIAFFILAAAFLLLDPWQWVALGVATVVYYRLPCARVFARCTTGSSDCGKNSASVKKRFRSIYRPSHTRINPSHPSNRITECNRMSHRRPNILLITSDQQHWHTLGTVNPEISTPNPQSVSRGRHLVQPRLLPESHLYADARLYHHRPIPQPAWCVDAGHETAGERAYRRRRFSRPPATALPWWGKRTSNLCAAPKSTPRWRRILSCKIRRSGSSSTTHSTDSSMSNWRAIILTKRMWGQHYVNWLEEKGCANWRDYFRTPTGNNDTQRRTWLIPEEYHYDTWIADRTNALMEEYAQNDEPFFPVGKFSSIRTPITWRRVRGTLCMIRRR